MNIVGLSLDEVRERTARGLVNKSTVATSKKISHVLRDNIVNLFNILITPMIIILVKLGLWKEVISVGALTLANTVIGIFQEIKAKMALDKIALIDVKKCTVIRGGADYEIPIQEIVAGDCVRVKAGDPFLADGAVVWANHLEVDESLLTGESDYIGKPEGAKVLSGSFCVSGSGVYTADSVGDESYVNNLAREAKRYHKFLSPLQHRVNDIIKYLITFAVLMTVLLVLDYAVNMELRPERVKAVPHAIKAEHFEKKVLPGILRRGDREFMRDAYRAHPANAQYVLREGIGDADHLRIMKILTDARNTGRFAETVRSVSAIIMTLVPQGLVLSITLIFIVGIIRMSRKGALIQKPNAIESMSHVNVICMDKTGTLTQNRLTLKEIVPHDRSDGALPGLLRLFASNSLEKNKTLEALTEALGDEASEILDAIPFSSHNKYSALRMRVGGETIDMIVGASSALRGMFDHPDPDALEREIDELSRKGYRVVVCAARRADDSTPLRSSLAGFSFRGLVVFTDEIKPEAREILAYFQKRKIELKIISGDHPETVKSIAQALDVENADRTVTGGELASLSPDDFERAVLHNVIFARINPQQKLDIVRALQRNNRYVAMVGDGVNDALAIKEAYLGICMGSGARISKDVSEITLVRDTFEIMPDILAQGQIIIQNVKDMAKLFLFKNSYSIMLIFVTQYLDLAFPFSPQHITLFNFITITVPSTYIILFAKKGVDMDRDYMREILRYSVTAGLAAACVALAVGMFALMGLKADEKYYQTSIVAAICLIGSYNFIHIYTWPRRIRELFDLRSILVATACVALLPAAMYLFDIVGDFFSLQRFSAGDWLPVAIAAIAGSAGSYILCKYHWLEKLFTSSEIKMREKSGRVERRR